MIAPQYPDAANLVAYALVAYSIAVVIAGWIGYYPDWGWVYRRQFLEVAMGALGSLIVPLLVGIVHPITGAMLVPITILPLWLVYRHYRTKHEREEAHYALLHFNEDDGAPVINIRPITDH